MNKMYLNATRQVMASQAKALGSRTVSSSISQRFHSLRMVQAAREIKTTNAARKTAIKERRLEIGAPVQSEDGLCRGKIKAIDQKKHTVIVETRFGDRKYSPLVLTRIG